MLHKYFPLSSINKIKSNKSINFYKKLDILSLILRLNILYSIQRAGSGHLGSSLSALDIFLCCSEFLTKKKGNFFSSKGHDAPALYNVMSLYNKISFNDLHNLRRLKGLPGHPDISTKNIFFNTGSLGMGISKINGLCFSNRYFKQNEKNIVILGDGELQEGQNWESLMFLQNNPRLNPLIIIDNNKIQSDTWVKKVKDFSNLKNKIKAFKCNFHEIDGHNKKKIYSSIVKHFKKNKKATIILANTIKGKGCSFFESTSFKKDMKFYPYHSGALSEKLYQDAANEIIKKINIYCKLQKISIPQYKKFNENNIAQKNKTFNLVKEYSTVLYDFVKKNKKTIVLDADLTKDTGNFEVMLKLPKQFVEFGIAEQDMVSFGSGLAAKKLLPIFHSFSCFLSTRSQEQIFNFCSENRKGIFLGALSGLTPSAPGHSHQMTRDIPLIGSMPNLFLLELYSKKMMIDFFKYQKQINKSFFIKINNSQLIFKNFEKFRLPRLGNFLEINKNIKSDTVVICQGADVLNEILKIKNQLKNITLLSAVWLNKLNNNEIKKLNNKKVIIFQSSTNYGSFDSFLSKAILSQNCKVKIFKSFGINSLPACGQNEEVLDYHNLSSKKMLNTIKKL